MYKRSDGVWTQRAKLVGTGAIGKPGQGWSVSLSGSGNTAIVGGYFDNDDTGAAWVYRRSGPVWKQQAKLIAAGSFTLGLSVSLSGDGNTAIVGGPLNNGSVGAAWVYERSAGVWTQRAELVGTGVVGSFATQGNSVSLSRDGNTAIVGGAADTILQGPRGCTRAHAACGASKRNSSAQVPPAPRSKEVLCLSPGTEVPPSWAGLVTMVLPGRYGCSSVPAGYGLNKALNLSAQGLSALHCRAILSRFPGKEEPPL